MITEHNAAVHELIGLRVKVVKSTDPGLSGLSGTVVDETKNVLVISDGATERNVPKVTSTFAFDLGAKQALVDGRTIAFNPKDRIKKAKDEVKHDDKGKAGKKGTRFSRR